MNRYEGTGPERKKTGPVVTGSRVVQVPEESEDWEQQQPEENEAPSRRGSTRLLTTIQIGVCGAVLVAAIALRIYGGELYASVRSWYFEALNDSIVADANMENMKRTVLDLWSAISSSREAGSSGQQSGAETSGASSGSQPSGSADSQEKGAASASQPSGSAPQSGSLPASQPQENRSAASPAQSAASPAGSKAP